MNIFKRRQGLDPKAIERIIEAHFETIYADDASTLAQAIQDYMYPDDYVVSGPVGRRLTPRQAWYEGGGIKWRYVRSIGKRTCGYCGYGWTHYDHCPLYKMPAPLRYWWMLRQVARSPQAGLLGIKEFRLTATTHFEEADDLDAYDSGRELAHAATFRRYEP